MEYILTSNQHEIRNNCLRYNFQKPIRFQNQYISLTSMIFYNYFENISDKFKLIRHPLNLNLYLSNWAMVQSQLLLTRSLAAY